MESVLAYIEANRERYLEELRRLLAVPSVSTNPENAADVHLAAEWLSEHMQSIGLEHVEVFCSESGTLPVTMYGPLRVTLMRAPESEILLFMAWSC